MSNVLSLVLSVGLALLLVMVSSTDALACSCAESGTVDKQFAAAKHVAILKATSYLTTPKEGGNPEEEIGGFKFTVQKVFKGSALKSGQQFTVISTGMCSFGFKASELGHEFLFYYYSDDQFQVVPLCSRSGPVEWRAADVLYLENLKDVRGLTRISGQLSQTFSAVTDDQTSRSLPLAGLSVRITGQGRNIRLKTDEHGVYEAYGLPPGTYRIEPEKVKGFTPSNEIRKRMDAASVVLPLNGQAERDFYYEIDNSIRGKLLDVDGNPVEHVRLNLIPSRGKSAKYFVHTAYSEKDGTFAFDQIPSGTYVIVGNPDNVVTAEYPYPRFYSSGTDDRSTATEITIGPGEVLDGFVIRASRPAETVIMSGQLFFEDGSPVTTGTVEFVTGNEEQKSPLNAYAYPDKNGNYRLKVLKGQSGVIFAYVPLNTWVFRECLDRVKALQLKIEEAKIPFPETSRKQVDAAAETSGVELRFSFTLCKEK